jgi:hypothetical protein
MKHRIIVHGHSLLSHQLAKEVKGDLFSRNRAFCSCGAWENIISVPSAKGQNQARRNWHDEHKREVWRRLHPEDFQEDRPVYADYPLDKW